MEQDFAVTVTAGTYLADDTDGVCFEHPWTDGGVRLHGQFTGASLLHAAVAGCVLNDVYREAARLGVPVAGVRVRAAGGFTADWRSTGVDYRVELASPAASEDVDGLLAAVDAVAEVPRVLRAGMPVRRV